MLASIRNRRLRLAAPTAALAVLVLAGCGGSDDAAGAFPASDTTPSTGAPAAPTESGAAGGAPTPGGRNFPGASGQIAEVSGRTMQVQNTQNQTAVTWTNATVVTDTVAASRKDIRVGDCVQVRDVASEATAAITSTPAEAAAADAEPVTAASVAISTPVDGSCTAGFPGGTRAGGPSEGFRPTGAPQARGDARPGDGGLPPGGGSRPAGMRGAAGTVAAIDGTTMTVSMPNPGTSGTSTRVVMLTEATTYTKTVTATASALKVGRCVTALGSADDTGAITATSITVRSAVDGACTTGFGRPGRPAGTENGNG
ncbi:hypothetical protein GCM10009547_47060 [Sporichthya brevicatena]|uniref:DUF5666 domain-containing protein n=1 Tax=Sporichthya brevicatena TaxID=171442 RepID=A0ABN1HBU2_9ACTN